MVECVEEEATLRLVGELGVDYAQGWHVQTSSTVGCWVGDALRVTESSIRPLPVIASRTMRAGGIQTGWKRNGDLAFSGKWTPYQ